MTHYSELVERDGVEVMDETDEIRARWAKATPGPWTIEPHWQCDVLYSGRSSATHGLNLAYLKDWDWNGDANRRAIAAAPTDIAALLAKVERLTKERDEVREVLHAIDLDTGLVGACRRDLLSVAPEEDHAFIVHAVIARALRRQDARLVLEAALAGKEVRTETLHAAPAPARDEPCFSDLQESESNGSNAERRGAERERAAVVAWLSARIQRPDLAELVDGGHHLPGEEAGDA